MFTTFVKNLSLLNRVKEIGDGEENVEQNSCRLQTLADRTFVPKLSILYLCSSICCNISHISVATNSGSSLCIK
jgi:hypothetical protein